VSRVFIALGVFLVATVLLVGLIDSPVAESQSAANLVERVTALETAVAHQTAVNEDIARRIEVLEDLVGVEQPVTPTNTLVPTPTRTPAPSPTPTATFAPTDTPTPSMTPGPMSRAASCEEILRVWREGSTDEFLALRRNEVIDKWIVEWEGAVSIVHYEPDFWSSDYYISVEPETGTSAGICGAYIVLPRKEDVLEYGEGQQLEITGQIEDMIIILGFLQLHLKDGTVKIEKLD
jgi:hypothetical protein